MSRLSWFANRIHLLDTETSLGVGRKLLSWKRHDTDCDIARTPLVSWALLRAAMTRGAWEVTYEEAVAVGRSGIPEARCRES